MTVTRAELDDSIERLRAEVHDPRAGLYGPSSVSWLVNRELVLFLAGGRAALMQLAHPFVAYAVDHRSRARTDLLGRFQRTFQHVFAMAFGDLDGAIASARRVHEIHARVTGPLGETAPPFEAGRAYAANDPSALFWVHATLVESAVVAFELLVRPLTRAEKEQYYEESRRFARLFGIPGGVMPETWTDFAAYNRRMWNTLRVAQPAIDMGRFLLAPPSLSPPPLARWFERMTAGLLPEPLREQFGLPFGLRERAAFHASIHAVRAMRRAMPAKARYVPAYHDALRRLAGKPGRDPIGAWIERNVLEARLDASSRDAPPQAPKPPKR